MNLRTLCLLLTLALVPMGCPQKGQPAPEPPTPMKSRGPAWPITPEKRTELGKMSRVNRETWFRNFGLSECEARRRVGPITIDGILDEPAWKGADVVELLTIDLGAKPKFPTAARMLWDDEAIYVAFECADPDVHAPLKNHDDALYNHDLVEIFVNTERSETQYMELHVAPSGATADVIWADFDPASDWFTEPGWEHFDVDLAVKAFALPGMQVGLKINGTLNNPDDTDTGYVVEWRIPFAGMRKVVPDLAKSKPHPIDMTRFELAPVDKPVVGTVWRMNFNRCDDSVKIQTTNAKGKTVSVGEYTAWSPPVRSNHMPFRFGIVKFVE